ncbi:MAG: insulinase family protein [Alkalinema sp. RU_4_3]|nr:insulinase family protein [Alkalinema sp. RU_4_3]
MKILVVAFCFIVLPLVLLLLAIQPAHARDLPAPSSEAKFYRDLQFPPLAEVKVPKYDRFVLPNGLIVYLMEDRDLPLISGTLLMHGGDRYDKPSQTGLGSLAGDLLRAGGTKLHTADQLNGILEQKAAMIESGVDSNSVSVSFRGLRFDFPELFSLFAEVVQKPAFDPNQLELLKLQSRGGIERRNDDPGSIASRELNKLIYGATSPYASQIEYKTIAAIDRPSIEAFYRRWVVPKGNILGIYGDFDATQVRTEIEAKFGQWSPTAEPAPAVAEVKQQQIGGVFFVDQPQLNQSQVQIGHLGGKSDSPDYPALSVMDEVLNGFGARLFNEVRSRQGLAYSVYASWSPGEDYPGMFLAGGETRSAATVPLIRSVRREIDRIRQEPISEVELTAAKDTVLNAFVFQFQSPVQTLSRLIQYEFLGYPADFLQRYRARVEATTVADVLRVAQTYLQPDRLVTLVVGNRSQIKPGLAELGRVKTLDIMIPQP